MAVWVLFSLSARPLIATIPVIKIQGTFLVYEIIFLAMKALCLGVAGYFYQDALLAVKLYSLIKAGHTIANARVLVIGFTFKENCPDLRNTRVIDVVKELQDFGCQVNVTDCWADGAEAEHEYGISLTEEPEQCVYSGVIVAVPHREYAAMSAGDLRSYLKADGVLFDLKGVLPLGEADLRL